MTLNIGRLKDIQGGKMKEIARLFFICYSPKSLITELLYPDTFRRGKKKDYQKGKYVNPNLQNKTKEWEERGYFDKKIWKIPYEKNGRKQTYDSPVYMLNLKPMYEYFEEKGIQFNDKEKAFVFQMLGQDYLRHIITKEFPDDDVIQACIKFYIKVYILPYANSPSAESRIKMRDNIIKHTEKLHKMNKKNYKKNKEITDKVWNSNEHKSLGTFEENLTNSLIIHESMKTWNLKLCLEVDGKFIRAHFGDVISK